MEASSAIECCNLARTLWLNSTNESELKKVEELYRQALETYEKGELSTVEDHPAKRSRKLMLKPFKSYEEYASAGEKLALLLCQSGRPKEAKRLLRSLGFICRLSSSVLDYPAIEQEEHHVVATISDCESTECPCIIIDNFLASNTMCFLKSNFEDLTASYWSDNAYQVEPPSPYFSFVLPIDRALSNYGILGSLISQIYNCVLLRTKFSGLSSAKYVEMWAHNRPHASGHQMHFDSDDEGRGGVRNPVMSTIVYVTAGSGGPSLITSQAFGDCHLAQKGWLCHPKEKRLVAFDGRFLHGVIPGKKVSTGGRRVTLMLAFWADIDIRREKGLGSSRPFPTHKPWAEKLLKECKYSFSSDDGCNSDLAEITPIPVPCVYETLDGKPWSKGMGLPSYDQVFQCF
jgi:hypothetical protein